MNHLLGKSILYTLGDNDAVQMADVYRLSPNGKYVYLTSDSPMSTGGPGWVAIDTVKVVDSWGGAKRGSIVEVCGEYPFHNNNLGVMGLNNGRT